MHHAMHGTGRCAGSTEWPICLAYLDNVGSTEWPICLAYLDNALGGITARVFPFMTHLDNALGAHLLQGLDEVVKLAVGEHTRLPAREHLQQELQVTDL